MRVEEKVDIAAPPAAVWAVLVDLERWPEWTASMRAVRLLTPPPLAVGSQVEVRQPRLPKAVWQVSELTPGRSFSWTVHRLGVRSVGDHVITPTASGSSVTVRFTQGGQLGAASALLLAPLIRRYVRTEAAGLRARCGSS